MWFRIAPPSPEFPRPHQHWKIRPPNPMIVRDAFRFLIPLAVSAAGLFLLDLNRTGAGVLVMTVFVAFFFRNPRREVPADPRIIVSPADGKVVQIQRVGNVTVLFAAACFRFPRDSALKSAFLI